MVRWAASLLTSHVNFCRFKTWQPNTIYLLTESCALPFALLESSMLTYVTPAVDKSQRTTIGIPAPSWKIVAFPGKTDERLCIGKIKIHVNVFVCNACIKQEKSFVRFSDDEISVDQRKWVIRHKWI